MVCTSCGTRPQVHLDLLVVAVPGAGAVVAGVRDAAVAALELPEPHAVEQGAARVEEQRAGVQIDAAAVAAHQLPEEALGFGDVPAEAHGDALQAAPGGLFEADGLVLAEAECHETP